MKSDQIRAGKAEALVDRLDTLATGLSGRLVGFQMLTAVDEAVAVFAQRNTIAAVPMKTIMFAISGVALVLVLLLGSHAADLTGADDAMVSARGASRRQRLISTLVEAFAVAIAGSVIGFAVGAFVMGPFGVATAIGGVSFEFKLPQTWTVVSSALIGATGAAMFVVSTLGGRSLLIARLYRNTSNLSQRPFFTRYYLDLAVAGVAVVLGKSSSRAGLAGV